jgi:hypothetical protein
LREVLPVSQIEEAKKDEQKYQELWEELSQYELLIDSGEKAIERLGDYQEQRKYYSGKKKIHTLENQFRVLPGGEDIVDIYIGELANISDITLFRNNHRNLHIKPRLLGDKAYIGEEFITRPYNKPKEAELSEIQKEENKKILLRRIGVEHLIYRVETFRVASDRFPLAGHRYSPVIMAVCGLVRLDLNYSFILSHDQDLGNWHRRWVKSSTSVLNKSDTESFMNPSEVAATGNIIQIFMRK